MSIIVENDVCAVVEGEAEYRLDGQSVRVAVERVENVDARALAKSLMAEHIVVADASALKFPFLLRHWMPGDWMRPLGLKGRKKLSDIFTNLKISREDKDRAFVVVMPSQMSHKVGNAVSASAHVGAIADIVAYADAEFVGDKACCKIVEPSSAHIVAAFGYSSGDFYCQIDDSIKITERTSEVVKIRLER